MVFKATSSTSLSKLSTQRECPSKGKGLFLNSCTSQLDAIIRDANLSWEIGQDVASRSCWHAGLLVCQTRLQIPSHRMYFLKYVWAIPVKSKSAEDLTNAMKFIFVKDYGRVPKNLQVDQDSEFYNSKFKLLMKKYSINLYTTYSNLKVSIVKRFNRTIKT